MDKEFKFGSIRRYAYALSVPLFWMGGISVSGAAASSANQASDLQFIPVAVHASRVANYGTDNAAVTFAPLDMSVIHSVMEDHSVDVAQVEIILQTIDQQIESTSQGSQDEESDNENGRRNQDDTSSNSPSQNTNNAPASSGNNSASSDSNPGNGNANGQDKKDDKDNNSGQDKKDDKDNNTGNGNTGNGNANGQDKKDDKDNNTGNGNSGKDKEKNKNKDDVEAAILNYLARLAA